MNPKENFKKFLEEAEFGAADRDGALHRVTAPERTAGHPAQHVHRQRLAHCGDAGIVVGRVRIAAVTPAIVGVRRLAIAPLVVLAVAIAPELARIALVPIVHRSSLLADANFR